MVEYLRRRVWDKHEVKNSVAWKYIMITFTPLVLLGVLLFDVITPPAFIAAVISHYIILFWVLFFILLIISFIFLFSLDKATAYPP
jgi:hypothetical protein